MGLSEEIAVLLQQELQRLDASEGEQSSLACLRRAKFAQLVPALRQMVSAFPAEYVRMDVSRDCAKIEFGRPTSAGFEAKNKWLIEPNTSGTFAAPVDAAGFCVRKTNYVDTSMLPPGVDVESESSSESCFPSAEAAIGCIVSDLVELVALVLHRLQRGKRTTEPSDVFSVEPTAIQLTGRTEQEPVPVVSGTRRTWGLVEVVERQVAAKAGGVVSISSAHFANGYSRDIPARLVAWFAERVGTEVNFTETKNAKGHFEIVAVG